MNTPDERRDSDELEQQMAWSKGLRFRYDAVADEPLPDPFRELLKRLDEADAIRLPPVR